MEPTEYTPPERGSFQCPYSRMAYIYLERDLDADQFWRDHIHSCIHCQSEIRNRDRRLARLDSLIPNFNGVQGFRYREIKQEVFRIKSQIWWTEFQARINPRFDFVKCFFLDIASIFKKKRIIFSLLGLSGLVYLVHFS